MPHVIYQPPINYSLSVPLILGGTRGGLEPIPSVIGQHAGCTLEKVLNISQGQHAETNNHSHPHSHLHYGQFRVSNLHVFGLLEEAGVPRENPHGENMQTRQEHANSTQKHLSQTRNWTKNILAVRLSCCQLNMTPLNYPPMRESTACADGDFVFACEPPIVRAACSVNCEIGFIFVKVGTVCSCNFCIGGTESRIGGGQKRDMVRVRL